MIGHGFLRTGPCSERLLPCQDRFQRASVDGQSRIRAGKPITTVAVELGVSAAAIHNWVRQDQIDRGERPGVTTPESVNLAETKKRIRQLEEEVTTLKKASKVLGEDRPGPIGFTR
ncbi:transposase [Curtobacterium sp. A7_M15]|uniref:transposase n=1 Tax=Curtobacterium sp. A7_M15 TaxID=3065241 RepID=UPI0035225C02